MTNVINPNEADRAEMRRAAVDKTVAEYIAYVKAHPGMLDDLAERDLSTAYFLVTQAEPDNDGA